MRLSPNADEQPVARRFIQGRGSYRLEHDSIFFENEGRVVMAGRVIDNAIFVHVLGNPAAMSGGANTDVLIQFSKS